jgi:hypothetical protein
MAIDITAEQVVTLTDACKHLPQRRNGKRPALPTLYRWTNQGCNGVRLECIMIGSTRCTSLESLQRFFDRLTDVANAEHPGAPSTANTSRTRQRQIEAAERRLAAQPLPAIA